ncbi:MAG: acetylxylan esterase [Planctomycetales bacterium]|nr:acetylxylan esterase [Planctomycetales bacterium]
MTDKTTLQKFGSLVAWLSVILGSFASGSRAEDDPAHYPKWSWDSVPVYLHFGSQTQLTDEQVATAARLSNFICLEKAHGRLTDRDHPERIMGLDARRLKQANPDAKVLMYWNTLIAWPFTLYNQRFAETHPRDWTLRDQVTGEPLLKSMLGDMPVYQYNLLNPEVRSWWASTAGASVKEFGFDGLYMDAISQSRRPVLLNKGWGRDKGEELDEAAIDMMKQVRAAMGPERLLVFNGLRTRNGTVDEETMGDAKFLPYADGAKIEHFDQFASSSKEDIVMYWRMATKAAEEGKIVLYKAWPDHEANFTNPEFMKQNAAELEAIARNKITFPLACYLIGAQRHSYFCYGWGYNAEDGQLVDYPEYRRQLGPPKGAASRDGKTWVFAREFEHASVRVDLESRLAKITWNTGDTENAVQPTPDADNDSNWPDLRKRVVELGELAAAPKLHIAEGYSERDNIKPIYFDGLPWQGKPTRVFAWLGLPQSIDGNVPGVVLVHGGGGTAFIDWVKKWNERGFAAISIAVEGQIDRRDATGNGWQRHDWAGPARDGIYGDSDKPLTDQWMYHAVADTILANSLLRSLPQVDAKKVGLMGISWGGVITSTVIGIDDRFAFAIPTYGCGGLFDAQNQYGRALRDNALYREVWDPLVRMDNVKMPVLWLSWTGDLHFPLDAQSRCYTAAPGQHQVALLPDMRHGHAPGWNPQDSYAFAESVVQTGSPWCTQLGVKHESDGPRISFTSTKPIDKAMLITTTDTGHTGLRSWTETPAEFKQNQTRVIVNLSLPPDTTAWFISLYSGDLVASSDFQQPETN